MNLNFLGQRKALIVIVKDDDVEVLTWEKGILNHNAVFIASEESLHVFGRFLDNHRSFPVIIIADVIEESFRYDSIAHVGVTDRKAILSRKLEYLFRETRFRVAKVTSRETTGRKDDKVLFSAVTKPELIKPWVNVILQKNMAIQALTSAAFILEKYAANQGIGKSDNLLLVSLEEGSNFRQTFLQNGRVLFSRASKLELKGDEPPSVGIRKETLQVRKYLERAKLLQQSSQLRFHVLSPFNRTQVETAFRSTDSFECLRTQEEASHSPLELHGNPVSTLIVVLAKILQKNRPVNIYGPLKIMRFHILRRVSQGLIAGSLAVLLGTLFIKLPGFMQVLDNWETRDLTTAKTLPYTREYDQLRQGFPETPIPSKEMELVVSTALQIQKHSIKPVQTMNIIGSSLAESPDLQIVSLKWSVSEAPSNEIAQRDPYGVNLDQGKESKFRRAIFEDRIIPKIIIEGIAYSPRSYREAQLQVESFVTALENNEEILRVVTTKMPTDVSSDTSVSTTVDDTELRSTFTLEVTVES